jgi:hypothetical protein
MMSAHIRIYGPELIHNPGRKMSGYKKNDNYQVYR